ncbi:MAG: hypothetical protein V5B40_20200 [Candidatus Accumulibacter meliphilus]|jgi:hypothetical protein|uniref:hypothetical protein n=1 Tax=Candidatus Accumulibacter meliphilus TaxID=2211374 RepID=UPI002FC2878B
MNISSLLVNARHCMASAVAGFMRTFGIDEPMGDPGGASPMTFDEFKVFVAEYTLHVRQDARDFRPAWCSSRSSTSIAWSTS